MDVSRKLGLCVIFLALLTGSYALSQEVRMGTGSAQDAIAILPILAAQEKGLWKEAGLQVKWVPFIAAAPQMQALVAGALDVGNEVAVSAILAIGRGVPQLIVADLNTRYGFHLWVKADSPIKRDQEIRGAKIGIFRFGGPAQAYATSMARHLGLEKQIKLVSVGGGQALIAAMKSGVVDAAVSTFMTMVPLKVGGEFRDLLSTEDYLPREWANYVFVAKRDFWKKEPEAIKKLIAGYFQGADFVIKNRPWSLEKIKGFFRYNEATARVIFSYLRYSKDGRIEPRALENVRNFILEYGLLPKEKTPTLDALYAKELAR